MKTIYIVSGFMRTGTSMMMKSLTAGGLTSAYNPVRDELNKIYGDRHYQPNPGGFYELTKDDYFSEDFPKKYEGKLVKLLGRGLIKLPTWEYKIVFMLRPCEEIRQSYEAFFSCPAPRMLIVYKQIMQKIIKQAKARKDIDIITLSYPDVVANPESAFKRLVTKDWPINVAKATEIVDPILYRFRSKRLTRGI